jgi:diguanylate cyclase (GGDEF)-like protein
MNGDLDPQTLAALLRVFPAVASAAAIGTLGLLSVLFFLRDRTRRDLFLYGLFALGVAGYLSLPLAPRTWTAAPRVALALAFALPATGYLFLLRFLEIPLTNLRKLILVPALTGFLLSMAPPRGVVPHLSTFAGVGLFVLASELLVSLAQPSVRRRPDTGLVFVGTSVLLLLAILEAASQREILLLPWGPAPFLGPGFLLFSALVLVAVADEGRRLLTRATTDPLTRLANRATFLQKARQEISRASRTGESLAIAMLDVDHFKSFNDRFGHQTGDRVLASVALAIQQTVRGIDMAGRYGGEEFVVLFVDADEAASLAAVERIRKAISSLGPPRVPERISVSAGVVVHEGRFDRSTVEELIACADSALYESKANGRDRATLAVRGPAKPTSAADVRYR